jgi:hypothetical protein
MDQTHIVPIVHTVEQLYVFFIKNYIKYNLKKLINEDSNLSDYNNGGIWRIEQLGTVAVFESSFNNGINTSHYG